VLCLKMTLIWPIKHAGARLLGLACSCGPWSLEGPLSFGRLSLAARQPGTALVGDLGGGLGYLAPQAVVKSRPSRVARGTDLPEHLAGGRRADSGN
jgi:hypothetical protein